MDPMKLECPKCSGCARLEEDGPDIWMRCICGFMKLVYSRLENGMTIRSTGTVSEKSLPRNGSKLSKCLGQLAVLEPATTKEVADRLNQNSSDTASQLTVLMAKGLTLRETERKGVKGGSTWELTERAREVLGLNREK